MIEGLAAVTRSTTDACADYLRDAILNGRYAEGSALVIDRLALQLGVSHTPIREAVRRLEAEGFLVYVPRKGAMVRQVDPLEFEELVAIRRALEPLVLERAIARHGGTARFQSARSALDRWKKKATAVEMLEAQWAFFGALYAPSEQKRILELISTNWRHVQRYHQVSWVSSGITRKRDYELKGRLLRACEDGNVELAQRRLQESIDWGRSLVDAKLLGSR